jgi:hypothetical protein
MPVFKYKTFDDADKALWNFHPDEAYYKQVAALWRFANKLSPITYPRGIFKFRNIEEANKHRDEFELAYAMMKRAERMRDEESTSA